jgi:Family of unknown function (DUF6491)
MSLQTTASVVLAGSAALVLGAISLPRTSVAGTTSNACFWSRDIRGNRAPDAGTVYLRVARNQIYELKLAAPCPDLTPSSTVTLRTRGSSRVCEGPGQNVEVVPSGRASTASSPSKCSVTSVRRLPFAEASALPAGAKP